MELFLDKPLTFEKLGLEARLSEDTNKWPQQILDQLYQQAPYSSDYLPKVTLQDVDADQRYAIGHIQLLNKLAINPRDDGTPKELRGKKKVLIPIIIQDGKLKQLDLIICEGKVEPLTEERLRKALFRPSIFESIKKRPGDMSIIDQLYPPHRQYGGGRGPMVSEAGPGLQKAAMPDFVMDAILPTIKLSHVIEVEDRINEDPSLRMALMGNEGAADFIQKLAQAQVSSHPSGQDHMSKVAHSIKPTVVQISKLASGGFRIKTANPDALIPDSEDVARPAAVGALGGDLVSQVEQDGTTTITTLPAVKDSLEDLTLKVANEFGLYKVRTKGDNKDLVGWVFPHVVDFSGNVLPLSVFTNGSQSAMQENIAGVPVTRSTDLLDSVPSGDGLFYYATSAGATAMVPGKVKSHQSTPEGDAYVFETVLGETVEVAKVPGLKTVTPISEARVGIPEDCGFIPLDNNVSLASSPDELLKTAEAKMLPSTVQVVTDGGVYSFRGQPIEKLAGVMDTDFLPLDDAVFLGTILGQEPVKLAHALKGMRKLAQPDLWFVARDVTPFRDRVGKAKTAAAKTLNGIPNLRVELLKEAAALEDPTAVDKILSLGFINPENVSIFAGYLPEFEKTIYKLSEVLMAARLGLSSVDEGAVQRAIVHMDKVTTGLRTLSDAPQA